MKSKVFKRPARTPIDMAEFMREFQAGLSDLGISVGDSFEVSAPSSPSSEDLNTSNDSSADENELGPFSAESETSRQAALQNYPRSGTQRWKVLTTIVGSGHGKTRDELAHELHLPDSSVDARVWELLKGEFIAESGKTRRTQAAAEASVLVGTDKGRRECAAAEGYTTGKML